MEKAFLEDTPVEVLASSVFMMILGILQFIPNQLIQGLPASSFLSGLFANTIDFVLMYSAQMSFHSYTLGLGLLVAAYAPFVYRDKAWTFSFLTQVVLSIYGFLTLIVVFENPFLVSDIVVLGLGSQVMVTGLIATQLFKDVLNSEAFGFEIDKIVYAIGTWQYLTGIVVLAAFQYVYMFRVALVYAVLFTLLGLYGVLLIYAALEISVNSRTGVFISGTFIALLLMSSVVTFSLSGAVSAAFIAGLIYWKKDFFEKRHSFSTLKEFEL